MSPEHLDESSWLSIVHLSSFVLVCRAVKWWFCILHASARAAVKDQTQ